MAPPRRQSAEIYQVRNTQESATAWAELNALLARLTARLNQLEGHSGTPTFYGAVDLRGQRLMHLAMPVEDDDGLPAGQALRRNARGLFDAEMTAIINVPNGENLQDPVTLAQLLNMEHGMAPIDAAYVVAVASAALTADRVLTGEATVITITDNGANSTIVVSITAKGVTFAKIQDIATDRLVGRDTAGTGSLEQLTVGGGVEFTGTGGIQRSALTGDVTASAGSNSTTVISASDTVAGKVELATAAETTTGTDATRAVTPDGLAGSAYGTPVIGILVSDPLGSDLTTGDGKAYVRIPSTMNGFDLVAVAAHVSTASTSGAVTVQVRNVTQAADMLSTRITIDQSEKDTLTAATPAVIDTGNDDVATGDEVAIDVDGAGTGVKGLFVELQFRLP